MACAIDPDNLDPESRLLKKSDEAWLTNLALIREITLQEKQAEEDRAFAARLAGVTLDDVPDDHRKLAMLLDDFDDNDDDNGDDDSDDDSDDDAVTNRIEERKVQTNSATRTPVTTSFAAKGPKPAKTKCTICMEFASKRDPRVPCGHAYCMGCLKQLFLASMQDETLMPPRCCRKDIPDTLVQLTLREFAEFHAKRIEYSTTDRLYCSKPTCSTFIPPTSIVNSVGTCPKSRCGMTTCAICKAVGHGNLDCPKDEATIAVLAAANEAGWTRCYRCRAMVELSQGCYHMTCRCRAEFCYVCSVPWKNCKCVQWDEARLYEEARDRTNRLQELNVPQVNHGIHFGLRVEQMANQLRANQECRHTKGWAYTRGSGRCEECGHHLAQYLFRCSGCHFMACNRCRRNRF